jgi:hypothetical protein
MRLSARDFEPTVFTIRIPFPAKIIGKRLISMMGSAIDLCSLKAPRNILHMASVEKSVKITFLTLSGLPRFAEL